MLGSQRRGESSKEEEMAVFEELPYGKVARRDCRLVTLCWDSERIDEDPQRASLDRVACSAGVYAIEGAHDASPSSSILYIGRTGHGDSKNVLSGRLKDSLKRVWWENDEKALRLYSDIWDVKVRWAPIEDTSIVAAVEHILITAHSPAFNSNSVRVGVPPEWSDILVINGGKKGRLLPVAFGGYFNSEVFRSY
jgi:hypothetical protein